MRIRCVERPGADAGTTAGGASNERTEPARSTPGSRMISAAEEFQRPDHAGRSTPGDMEGRDRSGPGAHLRDRARCSPADVLATSSDVSERDRLRHRSQRAASEHPPPQGLWMRSGADPCRAVRMRRDRAGGSSPSTARATRLSRSRPGPCAGSPRDQVARTAAGGRQVAGGFSKPPHRRGRVDHGVEGRCGLVVRVAMARCCHLNRQALPALPGSLFRTAPLVAVTVPGWAEPIAQRRRRRAGHPRRGLEDQR